MPIFGPGRGKGRALTLERWSHPSLLCVLTYRGGKRVKGEVQRQCHHSLAVASLRGSQLNLSTHLTRTCTVASTRIASSSRPGSAIHRCSHCHTGCGEASFAPYAMCPVPSRILAKQSEEAYLRVAGREAVYMTLISSTLPHPPPQLTATQPKTL